MKDFIEDLGLNEMAEIGIDLQVQLEDGTGTRPVLWLLCKARRRAASALADLAKVKPTDTVGIITLQSLVQSYDELMLDCREMLTRGKDADRQLQESERIEIADALDIDEAQELGVAQTPEDI